MLDEYKSKKNWIKKEPEWVGSHSCQYLESMDQMGEQGGSSCLAQPSIAIGDGLYDESAPLKVSDKITVTLTVRLT